MPEDYYSSRFVVDKMIDYIDRGRSGGKPFSPRSTSSPTISRSRRRTRISRATGPPISGGWTALRTARRDRAAALGIIPAGTPMVTMASTRDWNALPPDERAAQARAMAAYGGMAEAADAEIGRLVAHLKATGDYANTVFVFLSDNGAEPTDPMATFLERG